MSRLVAAARRYLGVPFRHRGRSATKLDCVGLVWRAYRDCGVVLDHPTDYGTEPQAPRFRAAIVAALGPAVAGPPQIGDVVCLRTLKHPHHVAIVVDHPDYPLGLLHASGEHGFVVEQGLDRARLRRITSIHRRPA